MGGLPGHSCNVLKCRANHVRGYKDCQHQQFYTQKPHQAASKHSPDDWGVQNEEKYALLGHEILLAKFGCWEKVFKGLIFWKVWEMLYNAWVTNKIMNKPNNTYDVTSENIENFLGDLIERIEAWNTNKNDVAKSIRDVIAKANSVLNGLNWQNSVLELSLDEVQIQVTETWKSRDKSLKESVPEFIQRVYGDFLWKGLTRAHLRIDSSLYTGLSNWLRNNNLPDWLDLPKARLDVPVFTPSAEDLEKTRVINALRGRDRRRAENDK